MTIGELFNMTNLVVTETEENYEDFVEYELWDDEEGGDYDA